MKASPALFLIPTGISPEEKPSVEILKEIRNIDFFVCERIRTTRRWLRDIDPEFPIDEKIFLEFDKHKSQFPMNTIRQYWAEGKSGGLTSEAGTPAVADPGFRVVAAAHRAEVQVRPLPGNNSLILGLMASGLNGNLFSYHGYFPIDPGELRKKLDRLRPQTEQGYTQIFIETPYRNIKTVSALLRILPTHYRLSVSAGILTGEEKIRTLTIAEWKQTNLDYLHKLPAVFYIGL